LLRVVLIKELISSLNSFFDSEYSKDAADWTTLRDDWREDIVNIFDELILLPRSKFLDYLFIQPQSVERISLKDLREETACSICTEAYDDAKTKPFRLHPCKHIFCSPCGLIWFSNQTGACPMCRNQYRAHDLANDLKVLGEQEALE
jgi:hypothetical protein